MSFFDQRFPDNIASGSRFEVMFSTTMATNSGGYVFSQSNWTYAQAEGNITPGVKDAESYYEVLDFFMATKGRHRPFRFRNHSDFEVIGDEGVLVQIGATNTYQMVKQYKSGGQVKITRPVSGTVNVRGGGVYSVNHDTGVVTHSSGTAPSGFSCDFDWPVRFTSDKLPESWIHKELMRLEAIGIRSEVE